MLWIVMRTLIVVMISSRAVNHSPIFFIRTPFLKVVRFFIQVLNRDNFV